MKNIPPGINKFILCKKALGAAELSCTHTSPIPNCACVFTMDIVVLKIIGVIKELICILIGSL